MPIVVIDGKTYIPSENAEWDGEEKTLGDVLKKCRQNCNMSLDRVADIAGISKSHLWEIERNGSEPSLWIAGKLAKAYGISLDKIANMRRA